MVAFNNEKPHVAYIASEEYHPCQYWDMGTHWVFITEYPPESKEPYQASMCRATHIQPYSDELWNECLRVELEIQALYGELEALKKGKLPKKRVSL